MKQKILRHYIGKKGKGMTKQTEPVIAEIKVTIPNTNSLITKTAELVMRIQAGETECYNDLYELVKKYVYYIAIKAGVSGDDAEEIVQETFISIFNKCDTIKEPQKALSWIKRTALNKAMDYLRKSPVQVIDADENENEFESGALYAPIELPEDVMENKETSRLIAQMIDNLPEMQAKCVRAFYYNEFKTKEIAKAYNISESAVKANLSRGRKSIEKQVMELAQKHGTKLVAFAVIPVFGSIFELEASACEVTISEKVFENALSKSKVMNTKGGISMEKKVGEEIGKEVINEGTKEVIKTGVSTTAKVGAGAAAKTGATVIGKSIATKVLIGLLAVGGVGGGVVAVNALNNPSTTSEVATKTVPSMAMTEMIKAMGVQIDATIDVIEEENRKAEEEARKKEEEEKAKAEAEAKAKEEAEKKAKAQAQAQTNTPAKAEVTPEVQQEPEAEAQPEAEKPNLGTPTRTPGVYLKPEYTKQEAIDAANAIIRQAVQEGRGAEYQGKSVWEIVPEYYNFE